MKLTLKRIGLFIIVIGLFASIAAGCGGEAPTKQVGEDSKPVEEETKSYDPGVTDDSIKLGVLTDITGPLAWPGGGAGDAVRTYFQWVNDNGGINGRKIEVIVEDHAYQPNRAVAAFKKVTTQDNVFAIPTSFGTQTCGAILKLAEEEKIPVIAASQSRIIFDPFNRYFFSVGTPYTTEVRVAVDYIVNELGKTGATIGLIYQDDDAGGDVLKGLRQAAEVYDISIVAEEPYKRGATDFSSQVMNIKKADPDYLFMASVTSETAAILSEAYKLNLRAEPVAAWNPAMQIESVRLAGPEAADGLWGIKSMRSWDDDVSGINQMKEVVKEYYPQALEDSNEYFVYGWVNAMLMAEALKRAGDELTRENLVAQLESLENFDTGGILAPVTYGPDDRSSGDASLVMQADAENLTMTPLSDWITPAK